MPKLPPRLRRQFDTFAQWFWWRVIRVRGEDEGGDIPEWVPEWASVYLKYTESQYYANEEEVLVGTLLGGGVDEFTTSIFDAGSITASGMSFANGVNVPKAIGPLATALAGDCTFVLEIDITDAPVGNYGRYLIDFLTAELAEEELSLGLSSIVNGAESDGVAFSARLIGYYAIASQQFATAETFTGIHKIAVTLRNGQTYSLSSNGQAVVNSASDDGPIGNWTAIYFGHYFGTAATGVKHRSLAVGPAQLDAALPALSALT
jgi:hypothetical protein